MNKLDLACLNLTQDVLQEAHMPTRAQRGQALGCKMLTVLILLTLGPACGEPTTRFAPAEATEQASASEVWEPRFGAEIEVAGLTGYTEEACMQSFLLRWLGFNDDVRSRQSLETRPWIDRLGGEADWLRGRGWTSTCDISVKWGDEAGQDLRGDELVSPILTVGQRGDVSRVADLARRGGGYTTAYSGVHVHVGAEHLSLDALLHLVRLAVRHDAAIHHVFKITPQRRCASAQPFRRAFLQALTAERPATRADLALLVAHHQGLHHTGIELSPLGRKGTVEVRYFNSSVDSAVVELYVDFALALVQQAARYGPFTDKHWADLAAPEAPAGLEALWEELNADPALVARLRAFERRPWHELGEAFVPATNLEDYCPTPPHEKSRL